MTVLESNHQQAIVRRVKRGGGWCVSTTRLAPIMRGIPDLLVAYRGLFIAIEVKGKRTVFHKLQQLQHARLRKAGVIVIVARDREGVELVDQVLKRIDAWDDGNCVCTSEDRMAFIAEMSA